MTSSWYPSQGRAEAAGVSKRAVYLHFDSKDELFEAIMKRVIADYSERWMERIEEDPWAGTIGGTLTGIAEFVDRALTPDDGADSEAGKRILRQSVEAARAGGRWPWPSGWYCSSRSSPGSCGDSSNPRSGHPPTHSPMSAP